MPERQVTVLASSINRITGWLLLVVGVFGFIYSLPGLMELTVLHNFLHLGTGAAALVSARSESASVATAASWPGQGPESVEQRPVGVIPPGVVIAGDVRTC